MSGQVFKFEEKKNENFGHIIFSNPEKQKNLNTTHNWLTLLEPQNVNYEPFQKRDYAVLSLFMKTSNMMNIDRMMRERGSINPDELDFITKYIFPVLVYMRMTSLLRKDYSFRMYLDRPTYLFLNKYNLNQIPIHTILAQGDLSKFIFNHKDAGVNKCFQNLLGNYFTSFKDIMNLQNIQCGDFLASVFFNAYYNPTGKDYSGMEVMLYDLTKINICNTYPFRYDHFKTIPYLFNLFGTSEYPHCDEGSLGQVVRTCIFRQHEFKYNYGKYIKTIEPPQTVLIRDAHRCPSTEVDTHIAKNNPLCNFKWVHNEYYYVGWHKRANGYQKRGPIFYYINAYLPPGDKCIMNDEYWFYTFGRIFNFQPQPTYKFTASEKEARNRYNIETFKNDTKIYDATHPALKHEKGLGYGIDEYMSLYVVYDEEDNNACEIQDQTNLTKDIYNKSEWINMYYNWHVFPTHIEGMNFLNLKEGLAFAACLYHMFLFPEKWQLDKTTDWINTMTVYDFYDTILKQKDQSDVDVQYLVGLIPPRTQIHGIVGLSHEAQTNMRVTLSEIDRDVLFKIQNKFIENLKQLKKYIAKLPEPKSKWNKAYTNIPDGNTRMLTRNNFMKVFEAIYERKMEEAFHTLDEYKRGFKMRHSGYMSYRDSSKVLGDNCQLNVTKWRMLPGQTGGCRKKKQNGGIRHTYLDEEYEVFGILKKLVRPQYKNKQDLLNILQNQYKCYYDKLVLKPSITDSNINNKLTLPIGPQTQIQQIQENAMWKFSESDIRKQNIEEMKLFDLADKDFYYVKKSTGETIVNMPIYDYISGMDDFSRKANSRELRYQVYVFFSKRACKQLKQTSSTAAQIHCEAFDGGKPKKEYVIYNKRKYLVRYDKRTKYILVNKVPTKLKDIK